jgi:hypothetical protein
MLDSAQRDYDDSYLHFSPLPNGKFSLDGIVDAERGLTIQKGLGLYMGPLAKGDSRTAGQRRIEALAELAADRLRGMQSERSAEGVHVGGQRSHVTLVVSLATLRSDPISVDAARRLACDASVTTCVVDDTGNPIGVARTRRTPSAATARAVALRDGRCRFPGCRRPIDWCDRHHIVHWADGGPSVKENLFSFCRPHHRVFHEGGWELHVGSVGEVIAVAPDGTTHRETRGGRIDVTPSRASAESAAHSPPRDG